jgi:hypothetical protein
MSQVYTPSIEQRQHTEDPEGLQNFEQFAQAEGKKKLA